MDIFAAYMHMTQQQGYLQSFFSKFPTIHLGNVILRDLRLSDAEDYMRLMSDPLVNRFLSDEDVPKSSEEAITEVRFWGSLFFKKISVFWTIADCQSDKLIGTVGYNAWNFYNHRAEICYDLMPEYWRKGIMSKVLSNVLDLAFKKMQINRIEAKCMLHNEASQKLLEKMNFRYEGTLRQYRIIRDKPTDIMQYGLLKREFNTMPVDRHRAMMCDLLT